MENRTVRQNEERLQERQRDIDTVTTEICSLMRQAQSMALWYAIEIGRRLKEAKSLLPHGEWGRWLAEKVDFSQSTANNMMKIFDEYGADQIGLFGAMANSQTLGNLPYTKALKLLAVPAEEREEFVQEHDVEQLSSRELEQLIKEKNDETARREKAEADADALRQELEDLKASAGAKEAAVTEASDREEALRAQLLEAQKKAQAAEESEKEARAEIQKMTESTEMPKDLKDKLRAEMKKELAKDAKAKAEKQVAEVEKKLEEAEQKRREAETEAISAKAKVEQLEKRLAVSSPVVAEFNAHFEQLQDVLKACGKKITEIRGQDMALAGKLMLAMRSVCERFLEG